MGNFQFKVSVVNSLCQDSAASFCNNLAMGPHDESRRSSSEYQTSGFESLRRSAETPGTELT